MSGLLLDANSIMLLTRSGWAPAEDDAVSTAGIAAYELGNAVWKELNIFHKLTTDDARLLLTVFHETLLRLRVEPQAGLVERIEILDNADRYGLSYYDSCYLTAAAGLGATLVTEDKGLKRSAEERGIPVASAKDILVS